MYFSSSLAVLLPLAGLAHAAMEPSMDNLTVNFFTANGNNGAGVPAGGTEEGALAVRAGTDERLSGSYTLLVFDSDRCSGDGALCTMQSNLTSASGLTLLEGKMVHELVRSSSQTSALDLPAEIESADGSMRLLFNTTDNPAPANAADLLAAPWSTERVVAGSEDKKPTKTRCRSGKGRKGRRRCKTRPTGSSSQNSTLDLFDSDEQNENTGEVLKAATGFVWGVVAVVVLVVV